VAAVIRVGGEPGGQFGNQSRQAARSVMVKKDAKYLLSVRMLSCDRHLEILG
jgi:hypothetical protein